MRAVLAFSIIFVAVGSLMLSPSLQSTGSGSKSTAATNQPADMNGIVAIDLEQAKAYYQERTLFIDARDRSDYDAGHVKGAISLPTIDFSQRFAKMKKRIQKSESVVVYCGGPTCPLGRDLAEMMIGAGIEPPLYLMDDGYPGWKMAGLPVR